MIEVFPIAHVAGQNLMYAPVNDWLYPRGDRLHYGNDLFSWSVAAKRNVEGASILAVTGGIVKFDYGLKNPLGGLTAGLQGDDGVWYYFAHMRDFVGVDRHVTAGEVIGHLGMTGAAALTGLPHLHFGMKPKPGGDEAWRDPWAQLHAAAIHDGDGEVVANGALGHGAMVLVTLAAMAAVAGGFWAMLHFAGGAASHRQLIARDNPITDKPFAVRVDHLYAWAPKVEKTIREVEEGKLSYSSHEPVRLSRLDSPRGSYFILDGHHRAVEAVLAGRSTIPGVIDLEMPRIERTGGAHRSILDEKVLVKALVKRS